MSQKVISRTDVDSLLSFAFRQICDPNDIFAPIDCVVPFDSANIYVEAIVLYHGRHPKRECIQVDGIRKFRITSAGSRLNDPCPF